MVSFNGNFMEIACLTIIPAVLMMAVALFIISAQNFLRTGPRQYASYEHAYFMITISILRTKSRTITVIGLLIMSLGALSMVYHGFDIACSVIGITIFLVGIAFIFFNSIKASDEKKILPVKPPWGYLVRENIRCDRQALLSRLLGYLDNLALMSRWIVTVAGLLVFWGLGEIVYFTTIFDTYYFENDSIIYLYISVLKIILGIILFTATNLIMIRPLKNFRFWQDMLSKG